MWAIVVVIVVIVITAHADVHLIYVHALHVIACVLLDALRWHLTLHMGEGVE